MTVHEDPPAGTATPSDAATRPRLQAAFNVVLASGFVVAIAHGAWTKWRAGHLDFIEVSFALQNLVMVALVLLRQPHRAVDRGLLRQAVALVAFLSGAAFLEGPSTGGLLAHRASQALLLAANVLGTVTMFNIGRSFGILIALRTVRTGGLYRVVRHPMYGTDILLRVGYLVSHCTAHTIVLFVLSTACYVARALLEERFLMQDPAYREYMDKVRYRFVPGVF